MRSSWKHNVRSAPLLLLALLASPLLAQQLPSSADLMDDGELVNRADVRQELEILEDQIQGMKASTANYLQKVKELQKEALSLEPAVGAAKMNALLDEYRQVKFRARQELLLPHQLQRLTELRWQYRAVRNPVVAFDQAVALSDDQKEKMRAKENELREQLLLKIRGFQDRQQREILEVLTPEQRLEWQKQVGEEFKFEPKLPGLQILRRLL